MSTKMFQVPSLTLILSGVFFAYILHSLWTIYSVFNPPPCDKTVDECLNPSWKPADTFRIFVAISTDDHPFASPLRTIWKDDNFVLSNERKISANVELPARTINNGSLFLHVVLTSSKTHRDITKELLLSRSTYHATGLITKYIPRHDEVFNLLSKEEKKTKQSSRKSLRPVTHFSPHIFLNVVSDPVSLKMDQLPAEIARILRLNSMKKYLPIVHLSEVRHRVKDLWPVNASRPVVPLEITFEPTTIGKLRFILILEQSLQMMTQMGFTEFDIDDVKGIFFDTGLYLLLITVFVTSAHVLFDFLAFKNDIQFWRKRSSMEGLALSTLLWRAFSQLIITLYLYDQKTSLLVLGPSAIAVIIEFWKLKKALKIRFKRPFSIQFETKTAAEMETGAYDSKFMKYLGLFVLFPLIVGGSIYSILYTPHKSWYSWGIQTLANGVYAFGFLFMTPQLFINYKLKSVAHLPFRVFMYKAFNTFIDDLFAFLLTSIPTSHRVAAFRDDVVFIIYLYQRWLYPVDKKRANEYGIDGDSEPHKDDAESSDESKKDK